MILVFDCARSKTRGGVKQFRLRALLKFLHHFIFFMLLDFLLQYSHADFSVLVVFMVLSAESHETAEYYLGPLRWNEAVP